MLWISPLKRTESGSKEIVLQPVSDRDILVKGYLAGSSKVEFEEQWPLGTAQADDTTQQILSIQY